jgi:D-aminopeptidase
MGFQRKRVRDYGIIIGSYETGQYNSITDVDSVKVGHATIVQGEGALQVGSGPVRTGVTAIMPHDSDMMKKPVEASYFVFNGAGTTTGLSLIDEFGLIETPVMLTNTLSVGTVYEGVVKYIVQKSFNGESVRWFNPVVGETSDDYLNDIGGLHVKEEHVFKAIREAKNGVAEEGNIGAGTGTTAVGFKAGIGTSSRIVPVKDSEFCVGALVQSNFGGSLEIKGIHVGEELKKKESKTRGSIMVIIATDAPLSYRQLGRVAKRGTLGITKTGWKAGHGSGDYFISFSTTFRESKKKSEYKQFIHEAYKSEESLNPLFTATSEAVEEAVLNSIFKAKSMTGRDDHVMEGIPIPEVIEILKTKNQIER